MSNRLSPIVNEFGAPFEHVNGKPRPELLDALNATYKPSRAKATYDAARDTAEFANHWANSDARDADSANSLIVRHKLMRRSRYESGSNGFYDGIIETHANMLVGVGPTLRMLTGNRTFNQTIERQFSLWCQRIQLRRKLWCMAHARTQDGETFALIQNNPAISGDVQLDIKLIEAEQCQTPFLPPLEQRYIDGISFDEFNNVQWYDILPVHPGAANHVRTFLTAEKVSPHNVLHWFKLKRAGEHRSVPSMTSTLNLGATSRRFREATAAAAETAADLNVMMTTQSTPDSTVDPMAPFSTLPISKRMLTVSPMGWNANHFKSEHPNANYGEFVRSQVSETGRPLGMPVNLALCDSSTYSFASGKLDTLCYRSALDVERQDCNDLVLDPLFIQWFQEWTILTNSEFVPDHQWDWPAHPVIDAVAEATSEDIRLKNGTRTLRQAYSDAGMDLEDQLTVMAEDYFGEASDENINRMREILLFTHYPAAAPQPQAAPVEKQVADAMKQLSGINARLSQLESQVA